MGAALTAEQRANLGAIKHFLEQYPMEKEIEVDGEIRRVRFNGHGRAPETEGRKELIEQSQSDSFKWVREAIENRQWPFTPDVISVQAIVGEPGNLPLNLRSITARKLSKDLRDAGAVQIGNMRLPNDQLIRCWVVRHIDQWRRESDQARGAHWDHFVRLSKDIEYARNEGDKIVFAEMQKTKNAYLNGPNGRPM